MAAVELKARKSFGPLKKGQIFSAELLGASVENLIEVAHLKMEEDGTLFKVPYDSFQIFWEESKETK